MNSGQDKQQVIPYDDNVVKHFANLEIKEEEQCVGWVTIQEYCPQNLRELLKEDTLTLEDRKRIAIGVKKGYKYLQDIGVIHMDMKPNNILIKDGRPKLIDFGLVEEKTKRNSYRQMGYARAGSKFRNPDTLCNFYFSNKFH